MNHAKNGIDKACCWMLATDMDGTIIPLDREPESLASIEAFKEAVGDREELLLAYITGRDLALALDGVKEHGLPIPDILVCDVGTSVYFAEGAEWVRCEEYDENMQALLQGVKLPEVLEFLCQSVGFEMQPPSRQGLFKGSLYLPPEADHQAWVQRAAEVIREKQAEVAMVYSREETSGRGLLDLLPEGVSKHTALAFLQARFGVPKSCVVYAGDSGNDEAVFTAGWQSIAVGNIPDDLRQKLLEYRRHNEAPVYLASRRYAHGVVEGWHYFRRQVHGGPRPAD